MNNNKYSNFAQDLRNLRKKAGLSQEELARRSGVSYSAIAKYETGKGNPKIDTVRKLLRGLGIQFDDYFFGSIEDIKEGSHNTNNDELIHMYKEVEKLMKTLKPEYMQRLYEYALDMYRFNELDD